MNQQELQCNSLEIFPLPDEYTVIYSGKKLVEHKIVRKDQKLGLQSYKAILPSESLEEDESPVVAIHPAIDDWVMNPSGNISIASISILSGSTLLISACCCAHAADSAV